MVGSEIYKLAERMEKSSRRELVKFKSAHGLHQLVLPNSVPARTAPPARTSKRSTNNRSNTPVDKEESNAHQPANDQIIQEAQIDSNEVTRDMKLEFVGKIKKLSNAGLTSLVEKIKEIKVQKIINLPEDKIEIKVDKFEKPEFVVISAHVDDLLKAELPNKRQKTEWKKVH